MIGYELLALTLILLGLAAFFGWWTGRIKPPK